MKKTQLAVSIVLCGMIVGCANSDRSTNKNIGALLGAGSGGIVGAQFGGGTGNIIAIAAGVIGGALLGDQIGSYLDSTDHAKANQARQLALTDGSVTIWDNPRSGHSGKITPLKSYQTASNDHCRNFRHEVVINGHKKNQNGLACRQLNGEWLLTN
jgi:surface antigen